MLLPPNTLPVPDYVAHLAEETRVILELQGIHLDLDWLGDTQEQRENIIHFFPPHRAPHESLFDNAPYGSFFTTLNLREERALIARLESERRFGRRRRRVRPLRERSPRRNAASDGFYAH